MESIRISRVTEEDFNSIVESAGGRRLVEDDSLESDPNADYILDNSILELKLVQEEGLEKVTRQRKLAEIYSRNQPNQPVVIIAPELLDEEDRRLYYCALEGPLKTAIKHAAKQLNASSQSLARVS